jgi:hypothetical protein
LPFPTHSHRFFLTGHEGNMGEIGRSMNKLEICRNNSMMKIIIEHHVAGIPKGRKSYRCFFRPPEVYIYEVMSKLYWRGRLWLAYFNMHIRRPTP